MNKIFQRSFTPTGAYGKLYYRVRTLEEQQILSRVRATGASILGYHLEGPFISLPGALPPGALKDADEGRVKDMKQALHPYRAVFSISPEFHEAARLIPLMAEGGAPVFMTHTRATVAETRAAIDSGARHATHFYDVFPFPSETEPGVKGFDADLVLFDEQVQVRKTWIGGKLSFSDDEETS